MESLSQPGTKRRSRRRREEWRALVTRFEESGQTRARFCAEMDISENTLRRWCCRFREQPSPAKSQAPVFVELPAGEKASCASLPSWEVELELDVGVILRLRRAPC
jgi:hypothetical protein